MNQKLPVILFDILQSVVSSMVVPGVDSIYFQAGRRIQILQSLQEADNSVNYKSIKYPLIAVVLPVPEKRGTSVAYYAKLTIPRIVLAQIVSWDGTAPIVERYAADGALKTILYPMYYEFLNRLSQSFNVISGGSDSFEHIKVDNPGTQPVGEGLNDFIDSIEIQNLQLTLSQIKIC